MGRLYSYGKMRVKGIQCLLFLKAQMVGGFHKPKSAISVMIITDYIFEQMYSRFEGAMGIPL